METPYLLQLRTCAKCKIEKALFEFPFRAGKVCKNCKAKAQRKAHLKSCGVLNGSKPFNKFERYKSVDDFM